MTINNRIIFTKNRRFIIFLQLQLLLVIPITLVIWGLEVVPQSERETVSYQPSDRDFPNPERGFFRQYAPLGNDPYPPLEVSQLEELRSEITLIRRIYLLSEFRDSSLSSSFLRKLDADFATARESGIKIILRFSYNWLGGGPDATQARISSHLEQLKPVLEANYDVIAFMEAGFIGAWGEWNKSTHGLAENPAARKNILLKLLSVLPSKRMVAIRYSHHKKTAFNSSLLPANPASNLRARARIGAHNDCFLASEDDRGTYKSTNPKIIARQKATLQRDNLYVVQGGELCAHNPPRTNCPTALKELAQMRWSTLNYYPLAEDLNVIFQDWQQQGCLKEISRRLGYRLRLVNSTLDRQALERGIIDLQFVIANDGWGSLYNPRKLEVILRHQETGREYYFLTSENPRHWQPDTQSTIHIKASLPTDAPSGNYQMLLNLPDPHPNLYNLPEYSIRLANQELWEPNTGYNYLKHNPAISIVRNASAHENYFQIR